MEMSLYYPDLGYYTSAHETIGKKGDYFTSPELTPAFGAMIAKQVEEMWKIMGEVPFTIVEFGAGTGMLCYDVLNYLKNNQPLYKDLRYCIIEKSPAMRDKQQQHLHEKVSWHINIRDIGDITGCILSNELIDNFSVHQVVMQDELMEVFVQYENGFTEILRPADTALKNYLKELDIQLPKDFRTELNLEAVEWIKEIAGSVKKGFIITIDYGYTSAELYSPRRSCGTLLCYNKHTINEDPYKHIGSQDITSHVNFSALCYWGLKNGLECCGLTDQAHFLLSMGFKEYLRQTLQDENDIIQMVKKESFLTHMLLVDMGSRFKVLIQQVNLPKHTLSGLRFS
jgi:SAM-dependent MidA family methyltransferase